MQKNWVKKLIRLGERKEGEKSCRLTCEKEKSMIRVLLKEVTTLSLYDKGIKLVLRLLLFL